MSNKYFKFCRRSSVVLQEVMNFSFESTGNPERSSRRCAIKSPSAHAERLGALMDFFPRTKFAHR